MRFGLLFAIVVSCVYYHASVAVKDSYADEPALVKKLWGKNYSEALSARDRADLMRADFEKRFPITPGKKKGRDASATERQMDAEAAKVVRAYREVIERYPHTKIAAYSALRLSGFYKFQGKFDKATKLAERTANEFADTSEGPRTAFNTGLIHAQTRHDLAEAVKWFARVPKPVKSAGAPYDEDDKLYLSAQQQLIKCEAQLRRDGDAKKRAEKLKRFLAEVESGNRPCVSISGQASPKTLEDSVGELGRIKPGAETKKAVAALARHGDAAVAEIERQLMEREPDFGRQHRAVRVLKEINSQQSRSLLLRMALGELGVNKPGQHGWAASRLIACDQREAWALLGSSTPKVLVTALNALEGQPVDDKHMQLLKKCFDNKDPFVGCRAAGVMAKGCTGKLANEAVETIAAGLTSIADVPDIDTFPSGWWSHTIGERYYRSYANALADMRVDNQTLHDLAQRLQDRARDAVLLALAQRGDQSVHDEMIVLAQNEKADLLRAWAVNSLRKIGTAADLPLLKKLAAKDPMVRKGQLPPPHPSDKLGPIYPVRRAAKGAISAIENKF